jgi:hypothetical protein
MVTSAVIIGYQSARFCPLGPSAPQLLSLPLLRMRVQLTENPATLSPLFATLTRTVRFKSFVCHSYIKPPRWGYPLSSLLLATPSLSSPESFFRSACRDYLLYFDTITHSLFFLKNLSRLFSCKSKLFPQNTRGGVHPAALRQRPSHCAGLLPALVVAGLQPRALLFHVGRCMTSLSEGGTWKRRGESGMMRGWHSTRTRKRFGNTMIG